MKVDKSTKILINLVLILMIALLLKFLITVPRNLYAENKFEYKVRACPCDMKHIKKLLDEMAYDGWKLHSINHIKCDYAIFER